MPEHAAAWATPAVSVICTAKNAAGTISETIASIQAQTLEDWEMVIVDDGSTDATADIVRQAQAEDPRIRLVPTPGIGRGRALNLALKEARAPLVANIDADDLSHPQRLAKQVYAMQARTVFGVLATECVRFYGSAVPRWQLWTESTGPAEEIVDVTDALSYSNPVVHSSVMYRRADIVDTGCYDDRLPSQFDYDLWTRLALAGRRIGTIALPLTGKRWHADQHFARRRRLRYAWNSLKLRIGFLRRSRANPHLYIYLLARAARRLPYRAWREVWASLARARPVGGSRGNPDGASP